MLTHLAVFGSCRDNFSSRHNQCQIYIFKPLKPFPLQLTVQINEKKKVKTAICDNLDRQVLAKENYC